VIEMKKVIIILGIMVLFILSTVICYAKTTTITYEEGDDSTYGISFVDGTITDEYGADILFIGPEDKEEGYDTPSMYADNPKGGILLNEEDKECAELGEYIYSNKAEEIIIDKSYCVLTREADWYVNVKVIGLSDDWSSLTIEWELLEEIPEETVEDDRISELEGLSTKEMLEKMNREAGLVDDEEVTEETNEGENEDDSLEKETEEETEKPSPAATNNIPLVILINAILLVLIGLTIIKIKKYS